MWKERLWNVTKFFKNIKLKASKWEKYFAEWAWIWNIIWNRFYRIYALFFTYLIQLIVTLRNLFYVMTYITLDSSVKQLSQLLSISETSNSIVNRADWKPANQRTFLQLKVWQSFQTKDRKWKASSILSLTIKGK